VRVTDFGLARFALAEASFSSMSGTRSWFAPNRYGSSPGATNIFVARWVD
jgi:hypothetical protein